MMAGCVMWNNWIFWNCIVWINGLIFYLHSDNLDQFWNWYASITIKPIEIKTNAVDRNFRKHFWKRNKRRRHIDICNHNKFIRTLTLNILQTKQNPLIVLPIEWIRRICICYVATFDADGNFRKKKKIAFTILSPHSEWNRFQCGVQPRGIMNKSYSALDKTIKRVCVVANSWLLWRHSDWLFFRPTSIYWWRYMSTESNFGF